MLQSPQVPRQRLTRELLCLRHLILHGQSPTGPNMSLGTYECEYRVTLQRPTSLLCGTPRLWYGHVLPMISVLHPQKASHTAFSLDQLWHKYVSQLWETVLRPNHATTDIPRPELRRKNGLLERFLTKCCTDRKCSAGWSIHLAQLVHQRHSEHSASDVTFLVSHGFPKWQKNPWTSGRRFLNILSGSVFTATQKHIHSSINVSATCKLRSK